MSQNRTGVLSDSVLIFAHTTRMERQLFLDDYIVFRRKITNLDDAL